MRILYCTLLAIIFSATAFAADSNQVLKSKMLGELDIIEYSFAVKYAPAEWKKNFAGWDLKEQIKFAKDEVLAKDKITIKEYQRILLSFFRSMRDYHVEVTFHSTEMAFLPFRIQGTNGRYFFAWVDHRNTSLPLAKGDELISFDGRPIADVVEDLKLSELGNPESLTDQTKAELLLTDRLGMLGQEVPSGTIPITVKHAGNKKTATYQVNWAYYPEEIHNEKICSKLAHIPTRGPVRQNNLVSSLPFFHKQMTAGFYEPLDAALKHHYGKTDGETTEEVGADPIGNKYSFVPALGKIVWKADRNACFHAYIYTTANKKSVGYVRIGNYMGGSVGPAAATREFQHLITKLEAETDALVIDQVNNPGGEVLHMYALISMLTNKPLDVPKHKESITQEDVIEAIAKLREYRRYGYAYSGSDEEDTVSGYPFDAVLIDDMTNCCHFIMNEWQAGNTITSPGYLYGIEKVQPHTKTRYTKPILVLVNEMALSCGDFLPAILQDNHRAKIFGTTTAGAGGVIITQTHPNLLGLKDYILTSSIAERFDHNPIENLGVTPDVIYKPTVDDLQNGFSGYGAAVNKAIDSLFKK